MGRLAAAPVHGSGRVLSAGMSIITKGLSVTFSPASAMRWMARTTLSSAGVPP